VAVCVGIDPGKSGALAFLGGEVLHVIDMPGDRSSLGEAVERIACTAEARVWIERAQPMRKGGARAQGVSSTANYLREYGIIIGMLEYARVPYEEVQASVWKPRMGVTAEKESSLVKCVEHFGDRYRHLWWGERMGLLDGRCEAALLAVYGRVRIASE